MKTLSKKTERLLEIVKKSKQKQTKQTTLTGKPRDVILVFGNNK